MPVWRNTTWPCSVINSADKGPEIALSTSTITKEWEGLG